MNNKGYINSSVLIGELIQDYNLQSQDFVTRFPNWCVQCLGDLNIYQAYVEKRVSLALADGRVKLPDFYRAIIGVWINNEKATPKNPNNEVKLSNTDNKVGFVQVRTSEPNSLASLAYPQTVLQETKDCNKQSTKNKEITYYVNQGWLHVIGLDSGTVTVDYLAIPIVYDANLNMNFPIIYNDEILKEAIKLFILKRMLNRGYVHPVQNLRDNNPYTNPALRYDQIRFRVRTSVNKFTVIDRDVIAKIVSEQSTL